MYRVKVVVIENGMCTIHSSVRLLKNTTFSNFESFHKLVSRLAQITSILAKLLFSEIIVSSFKIFLWCVEEVLRSSLGVPCLSYKTVLIRFKLLHKTKLHRTDNYECTETIKLENR